MKTALFWFRRDLRLVDNPALTAALAKAERVIPVYIYESEDGPWQMGSASRWWLHHSLASLDAALKKKGSRLILRSGSECQALKKLMVETDAVAVYWNRRYEPHLQARDTDTKRILRESGFLVETYKASLLYEPWELRRANGQPYRVFTPFWIAMQKHGLDFHAIVAPSKMPPVPSALPSLELETLSLLPSNGWDKGFYANWNPGESGAALHLEAFIGKSISSYKKLRDRPDLVGTSRLSPHIHFGEIGPRQIVAVLRKAGPSLDEDAYLRELAWRDFAYNLLYHFPHTTDEPLDNSFGAFPWADDYDKLLKDWQRGLTGFPMVDAGMRELWHTGWMHNRVRMIVASLLTKNLLIPWKEGARWFWHTLVDADLASNTMGWQWTAGCGADAAPYFRVFNPVLQGKRYDPEGNYVRRWVPELAKLPTTLIHQPWRASESILEAAGVKLGVNYPMPCVDLAKSRRSALEAFGRIKARAG